ncbi:MAG: hypothetical protein KDA57_01965 [Planctomycetales bacterium]|nr:hypothetical protein [Planctomycetales bacterium]
MKLRFTLAILCGALGVLPLTLGCKDSPPRSNQSEVPAQQTQSRRGNSAILLETISSALNALPEEIVLELAPPRPILDDSKSTDGKEVLATCNVTPAVPDGPFNYLEVPQGNVDFRKLGVRAGDIVRYYVAADEESSEFGIRKETYLELPVRRLDSVKPATALIVEVGLNGMVPTPERIEIWRFSDKRMNEIRVRLTRYIKQRRPAIHWEPSPDESALALLLDRLNQWLRNTPSGETGWQADPLLSGLPEHIRSSEFLTPFVSAEAMEHESFQPFESRELQQAIWMRDISAWAKSGGLTDLEVASALFDWTVRNIQLDDAGGPQVVFRPWQALMYGHGTVEQRAWVFAELCRQQHINVVLLGFGEPSDESDEAATRDLLPALLSDGQLYLFDSRLGLPIPGNGNSGVATLAEIVANPSWLESLSTEEVKYPIAVEDLSSVKAYLVAAPLQLSRRASLLQNGLEGDNFVVLSVESRNLATELEKNEHVSSVQLWPRPWEALLEEQSINSTDRLAAAQRFLVFAQRPRLWKARVLHFQGTKEVPFQQRNNPLAEPKRGHVEAIKLYQDRHIRPPDAQLDKLDPGQQGLYRRAKGDASYWLGLLSYDRGNFEIAVDWLGRRTLEAEPAGDWASGARYNLARTYEKLGKIDEAIHLLQADNSPQRHGNLLRARTLQQSAGSEDEPSEESESP